LDVKCTVGFDLIKYLSNFDLSSSTSDFLSLLKHIDFKSTVTPEITDCMLETATQVHMNYQSLIEELIQIKNMLVSLGDKLNIGICGGGTHPFQQWTDRRIYNKSRYKRVSELYGYLSKQFTVFGQHVHIGCRDGNEALFLLHSLGRYLPHFIALSASSPFIQGHDTFYHSSRLNSVFAFPLSGRAPFILDWQLFSTEYFEKMALTGTVNSMKDFYWDIRPKPEYGTVELRICDTPLDVKTAAILAAYLQTLSLSILENKDIPPKEDDYLVYNYNRFQACRFGLEGMIINPRTFEKKTIKEDIYINFNLMQLCSNQMNPSNH
jgi:carboxylate-amine ligase